MRSSAAALPAGRAWQAPGPWLTSLGLSAALKFTMLWSLSMRRSPCGQHNRRANGWWGGAGTAGRAGGAWSSDQLRTPHTQAANRSCRTWTQLPPSCSRRITEH